MEKKPVLKTIPADQMISGMTAPASRNRILRVINVRIDDVWLTRDGSKTAKAVHMEWEDIHTGEITPGVPLKLKTPVTVFA